MIKMSQSKDTLGYGKEMIRKSIHLSTSLFAFLYYYFDKPLMLAISLVLTAGFLFVDLLRMFSGQIEKYFHIVFSGLLRNREMSRDLTGATYLFAGISLTILLFERNIAIASILVLTISDTIAAVIGKKFGRNKIGAKSVEGSIAFFISTVIIIWFVIKPDIFLLLFISALISFIEAAPLFINDNLSIPLFSGLLLTVFH